MAPERRKSSRKKTSRHGISRKLKVTPILDDPDSYGLPEFCARHRIGLTMVYKYPHLMPQTYRVGKRVLVTREAAAKWRADREREALEAAAAKQAAE